VNRMVRITLSLGLASATLGLAVVAGAGGALSAPTKSARPANSEASGKPGPRGPRGPAGPRGLQGPAGPSEALATYKDGPVVIPAGMLSKLAGLDIPTAGSYVVTAKAYTTSDPGQYGLATCQLDAQGDTDVTQSIAEPSTPLALSLEVVHTFATPGPVNLNCSVAALPGASLGGSLNWIKLVAIRVGKLTNTPG
jgi:hypothetical protein